MKKMIFILLASYAAATMVSFTGGFGNPATGAPGETGASCAQGGCHSAGAYNPEVVVTLIDADGTLVDEYLPGANYTVALKINHTGLPAGYGFQMVCLADDENSAINNFVDLPEGIKETSKLDRQYIEQSRRLPVDSISVQWTAPAKETGSVTFYAIGNAVNGMNGPQGDGAANGSFSFGEALGSSTNDLADIKLNIFPNPTQDKLNISSEITVKEMTLYDLHGKTLRTATSNTMSIYDLPEGRYIIRVRDTADNTYSESIQKI